MRVVLFEGKRNARVDEVIQACLGTTVVATATYNSEGWQCNAAYLPSEGTFTGDDLRRLHLALMDIQDTPDTLPDLYDTPNYQQIFEEPLLVSAVDDGDEHNDVVVDASVVGWVIGGSWYWDDEVAPPVDEDVYQL